MRGVIIVAVGSQLYGRMSTTLAVSIKHGSDVRLGIVYTASAFSGIEWALDLFDHKEQYTESTPPEQLSMQLKVTLPNISSKFGFTKSIFLDADMIICPTHSVDEWFDELDGCRFAAYNVGFYTDSPNPKYHTWAEPQRMRDFFKLGNRRLPQINSSFLYFEDCDEVNQLFSTANDISNSDFQPDTTWRGLLPDELCLNVACAVTGIYPHKQDYRPIYLPIISLSHCKEHIIENYVGLSVISTKFLNHRLIGYYNDFMEYYFDIAGINRYFRYMDRKPKSERPTYGFYHVCMINNWLQVVEEQVKDIITYGLYDKSDTIFIGAVGSAANLRKLMVYLKPYRKFKVKTHVTNIEAYEFPTLRLLKGMEGEYFAWYIHTKAVSNQRGTHWRHYMNYYNLRKWEDAQQKLKEGYDIVGVKWLEGKASYPRHFSGNFYHICSEYVSRLPEVNDLDTTNRFQAEFWSGMGNPNYFSLCQKMIDYNNLEPFK